LAASRWLKRARELEALGQSTDDVVVRILDEWRRVSPIVGDTYDDVRESALIAGLENLGSSSVPYVEYEYLVDPSYFREGFKGVPKLLPKAEDLRGTFGRGESPTEARRTLRYTPFLSMTDGDPE
jgi:hypothetical protein